jgi:hypothetical protein
MSRAGINYYHSKLHKNHKAFMEKLMAGAYPTIDDSYVGIKKFLKPTLKDELLRGKK